MLHGLPGYPGNGIWHCRREQYEEDQKRREARQASRQRLEDERDQVDLAVRVARMHLQHLDGKDLEQKTNFLQGTVTSVLIHTLACDAGLVLEGQQVLNFS